MAIVSNIVIDFLNKEVILTSTVNGNYIETITYSNVTNKVTFNLRHEISVTSLEFLDFVAQVNIFNTAILFNWNPNVIANLPFGSCQSTENHDIATNKWSFVCIYGANPRVCNYLCDGDTKIVSLVNRANSKIIDFPEWLHFLIQLNHYRNSIKVF